MSHSSARAEDFLNLLRPLQGPLGAYCRRMLRDRGQADDALQSAVAAAFRQFQGGAEVKDFKAWAFRFVTLEALNRNRKREPAALGEADEVPVEEPWGLVVPEAMFEAMLEDPDVVLEQLDDGLVEALEQLPALERAALLLRALGEFSYQEVHELLGIPLGSVIGYLSRARKRLRLALAGYAAQRGWPPGGHQSKGPES